MESVTVSTAPMRLLNSSSVVTLTFVLNLEYKEDFDDSMKKELKIIQYFIFTLFCII
jgi:hypothetical protein